MLYDFNIVVNPYKDNKEIHSFTIDDDGGVFKSKGSSRNYLLSWEDCNLITKAGGVNKIWLFLKQTDYRATLTIGCLKVVNLNP